MIDTAALQRYSLFGGMIPDQVERIRPLLVLSSYAEGESVLREGEPNDSIFFILDGRVAIVKGSRVLTELGEGETFGEMELLDVQPSAATVRALKPLRVAAISNRAVRQIYCLDPKIFALLVMNLARDLSRKLRKMDDMITALSGPADAGRQEGTPGASGGAEPSGLGGGSGTPSGLDC